MLTFQNPGELDLRLTQLFGANVKPQSTNPIGHFGTGLKYAIAIVLRLKGKITIYSGVDCYNFHTKSETIRGKDFQLVYMDGPIGTPEVQMPFTLELGKDWLPWMAYRELWSNAKDEGGSVLCGPPPIPAPNTTNICVSCAELEAAHKNRREFILDSTPIHVGSGLEVHRGSNTSIYYQGLKVFTTDKPGIFSYNITHPVELTEDRTLANWWGICRLLIRQIAETPREILDSVLLAGEAFWEWNADWDCFNLGPSPNLQTHVTRLAQHHLHKLPLTVVKSALPPALPPPVTLTAVETKMLERALEFNSKIGHRITQNIQVVESLGSYVYGAVHEDVILLTKEAFRQGTKIVAGTLLEEHLHIIHGFKDNSREMQNHLLNLVISLGEELIGDPL